MNELTATQLSLTMMQFNVEVCDPTNLLALKMAAMSLLENIDKHEHSSH